MQEHGSLRNVIVCVHLTWPVGGRETDHIACMNRRLTASPRGFSRLTGNEVVSISVRALTAYPR
jgi:hypothetical protein